MLSARPARLASALLALGLAAGACGTESSPVARDTSSSPSGAGSADEATSSGTPTPGSDQSGTPSSDPTDSGRTTVAAYFVGDTPAGPRLFREFRSVPEGDPLTSAAGLLTRGDAADPDYRSLFPEGSFAAVTASDGMLVAELADGAWRTRPDGMSALQARLAVQQLVHTLQAAQQARVPVTVLLDGRPTTLFGVDTSQGVTNADQLEVLALVNVTAPEQDASVQGTLRASGVANSPEANVPWEVRQGSETVLSGFATAAGWLDKLYPWEAEIDVSGLEPGSYTFVARTDDQSDGEGLGPTEDSKEFTVR